MQEYWDDRLKKAGEPEYRAQDPHKLTHMPQQDLERWVTAQEEDDEELSTSGGEQEQGDGIRKDLERLAELLNDYATSLMP